MLAFCGKSDVKGLLPLTKGNSTVLGSLALDVEEPKNAANARAPVPVRSCRRAIELPC
jgi:hypothetical protein